MYSSVVAIYDVYGVTSLDADTRGGNWVKLETAVQYWSSYKSSVILSRMTLLH